MDGTLESKVGRGFPTHCCVSKTPQRGNDCVEKNHCVEHISHLKAGNNHSSWCGSCFHHIMIAFAFTSRYNCSRLDSGSSLRTLSDTQCGRSSPHCPRQWLCDEPPLAEKRPADLPVVALIWLAFLLVDVSLFSLRCSQYSVQYLFLILLDCNTEETRNSGSEVRIQYLKMTTKVFKS